MPLFISYITRADGREYKDRISAKNISELRNKIESRGDTLDKAVEDRSSSKARKIRLPIPVRRDLFLLLAMHLESNVMTIDAIAALRHDFPDAKARLIMQGVYENLRNAEEPLSSALGAYPKSFPDNIVSMLRAGEAGGPDIVLARIKDIADYYTTIIKLRDAILKAVAYPIFICFVAGGVVSFILTVLVPKLMELFDILGASLPDSTKNVIFISGFLRSYWPFILCAIAAIPIAWKGFRSIPGVALGIDMVILQLPLVGPIYRYIITANIAKNYRGLYLAGESAAMNLRVCATIVNNKAVCAALLRAASLLEKSAIRTEDPDAPLVTEALRTTGYFPSLALTIIGTGEKTGQIAAALQRVSIYYTEQADKLIDASIAVFNRIFFMFILSIIFYIVIAMMEPIFTASQHIRV